MSERIVGRGAQLQQVAALVADATAGPLALVLTGDAGIGKTTIWEAGVRLAGERGLCVLVARPAEGEAGLPFAALGDLLGALTARSGRRTGRSRPAPASRRRCAAACVS